MKLTPAFFHEEKIRRVLERAAAITAVPICVHGNNDWRITGWGGCEACAWINHQAKGKRACKESREDYLKVAKTKGTPVTFVCHMGFTCILASIFRDEQYTLVLGPYLPENNPTEKQFFVNKGLAALGVNRDLRAPLPFSLDDIRTAPEGSIQETAAWLLDEMRTLFNALSLENDMELEDEPTLASDAMPSSRSTKPGRNRLPDTSPVELSIMALSLLCGRTKEPRAFLIEVLDESNRQPEQMRPAIIRTVSELLDAAKRQGGDIERAWNVYAAFVAAANTLNTREELLKGAEKVLRRTARTSAGTFTKKYAYLPEVMDALHTDYTRERLLTEISESTGVALSTITRMLEKKTGANFAEVLGRIRILHARRLLRKTGYSATLIARRVGIHDQANFGKLFKRYSKYTPGAYRARFRK